MIPISDLWEYGNFMGKQEREYLIATLSTFPELYLQGRPFQCLSAELRLGAFDIAV